MSVELSFFFFLLALMVAMLGATGSSMHKPPAEGDALYKGPWKWITSPSDLPQTALIAADAIESPAIAAAGKQ
ncbi:MAG TPA: hypothetical protein PLB25_00700 [Rhodoferax sp.]|nr:hypothetical protein [Rhodoferax sp.]